MGADSPPENTPNASKKILPKISAQAQKFEIFEKKLSLGVPSPCPAIYPWKLHNFIALFGHNGQPRRAASNSPTSFTRFVYVYSVTQAGHSSTNHNHNNISW